jgi:hypothetical protein
MGLRRVALIFLAAVIMFLPSPAEGREEPSSLESLAREFRELRALYEERIAALEARIADLEREARRAEVSAAPVAEAEDDLAALRAAAWEAAGADEAPGTVTSEVSGAPSGRQAPIGHERNLNRLNPEISFTGDVLTFTEAGDEEFDPREFELDLQAALDPFSKTKWTIAYAEEEVEIEEGYVEYSGLATGLGLRAGKMRQTFGPLNRHHLHALPQVDYPLVHQRFFGAEGLAQTGISVDWLLPRSWASANELTFQLTDGSSDPFGGDSFERLAFLGHFKNYWDLSPSTYLEWGLSGASGSPEPRRQTNIWGTDLTYHWQPPSRAKYREITWRSEVLLSHREVEVDPATMEEADLKAWGGYTYVEGLFMRNLYAGLRYDLVEDPLAPGERQWAVEPYMTWWQSEYVRLRAAYRILRDGSTRDLDHSFLIQLTWSAGPHRHEAY